MCRIPGLEEFDCYDEFWLKKDMENLGYIFEFCDEYCKKLFGVWVDKVPFLDTFMRSRMRVLMEIGHPRFVSQAAISTLRMYVEEDFKSDLTQFKIVRRQRHKEFQFYWGGSVYAYIHFQTKLSSLDIINILPIEQLLTQYYPGGHCMSIEGFYDRISEMFK